MTGVEGTKLNERTENVYENKGEGKNVVVALTFRSAWRRTEGADLKVALQI
jgi:hypothetical protein